jgi:hypothetical protein
MALTKMADEDGADEDGADGRKKIAVVTPMWFSSWGQLFGEMCIKHSLRG